MRELLASQIHSVGSVGLRFEGGMILRQPRERRAPCVPQAHFGAPSRRRCLGAIAVRAVAVVIRLSPEGWARMPARWRLAVGFAPWQLTGSLLPRVWRLVSFDPEAKFRLLIAAE